MAVKYHGASVPLLIWNEAAKDYVPLDANNPLPMSVSGSSLTKDTPLPIAGVNGSTLTVPRVATTSDNDFIGQGANFAMEVISVPTGFNGSSSDRWRNNTEGTLLAGGTARTATTLSPDQVNYNAHGVQVTVRVTANPGGTDSLYLIVWTRQLDGSQQFLCRQQVITAANGVRSLFVYPNASLSLANSEIWVQGLPLGRTWGVTVEHSGVGSWTYSLESKMLI